MDGLDVVTTALSGLAVLIGLWGLYMCIHGLRHYPWARTSWTGLLLINCLLLAYNLWQLVTW